MPGKWGQQRDPSARSGKWGRHTNPVRGGRHAAHVLQMKVETSSSQVKAKVSVSFAAVLHLCLCVVAPPRSLLQLACAVCCPKPQTGEAQTQCSFSFAEQREFAPGIQKIFSKWVPKSWLQWNPYLEEINRKNVSCKCLGKMFLRASPNVNTAAGWSSKTNSLTNEERGKQKVFAAGPHHFIFENAPII